MTHTHDPTLVQWTQVLGDQIQEIQATLVNKYYLLTILIKYNISMATQCSH